MKDSSAHPHTSINTQKDMDRQRRARAHTHTHALRSVLITRDLRAISVDRCWDKISIQRPLNNVTSYGRLWRKRYRNASLRGSVYCWNYVVVFCFVFCGSSRQTCLQRHKACVYLVMTGARFNCFSDDQDVCAFIKNTHSFWVCFDSLLSSHVVKPTVKPRRGHRGRRTVGLCVFQNIELSKFLPLKTRNGSEYGHACFGDRKEFCLCQCFRLVR